MGRTFTPKTPGVFADPETFDAEVQQSIDDPRASVSDEEARSTFSGKKSELVMQPAPDLAAFIAAEVAKGVAAALATSARAMVQAQPEHLPDQRDVDPNSISESVLTRQGYVVPAKYGNFAADIVKR